MKKFCKILSLTLLIIGLFLIEPKTTGAVIGASSSSIIGILLIVISGLLFIFGASGRPKYRTRNLENLMHEWEKDKGKIAIILDTSGAIEFKRYIGNLLQEYKGHVFIPKSVIDELSERDPLKKRLEENTTTVMGYTKFEKVAKDYLKQTPKHQAAEFLLPYLEGEKDVSKLSRRELQPYNRKLIESMEQLKQDPKLTDEEHSALENIDPVKGGKLLAKLLRKHWLISETDIDVMASGMYEAEHGRPTKVVAEDTHLRDAVNILKAKNPKIGRNLEYVNCREYLAA